MKKQYFSKSLVSALTAAMLAILICLPAIDMGNNHCAAEGIGENYKTVAESDSLEMYADMETGHFAIKNKVSGHIYYSDLRDEESNKKTSRLDKLAYGSQLIVDYAFTEDFAFVGITKQTNSTVECVKKGTVTVKEIKNGISVLYDFKNFRFSIPVEYKLENDKFTARIVTKKIREGNIAKIINISLLPSLGATNSTAEGYILVPDGSGALINFNSGKEINKYDGTVYGEDLSNEIKEKINSNEVIRMPIFAICENNVGTLMGNITVGDSATNLSAISGNGTFGYNICYSRLNYRTVSSYDFLSNAGKKVGIFKIPEQRYNLASYEIEYTFLDKNHYDYVSVAGEYRKYLIEKKGLKKNDKAKLLNLDTYGALETKGNFLGIKYSKYVPLTEYDELEKIYTSLNKKGVTDVDFRYIGWQNDGISNKKVTTKSSKIACLGGNKGFKRLMDFQKQSDVNITFDTDLLQYRKSFVNIATSTAFNKKAEQFQYLRSVYSPKISVESFLLIKPSKIEKYADSYLKNLDKNVEELSLSTCTSLIYSDFKKNSNSYRSKFPEYISKILKKYEEKGLLLSGESANAYTFPLISKIYNAPTKSSGYKIFDKEIPFYQIVLKGYVSMTTGAYQLGLDKEYEFLKAVESGSALLYNCIYKNQVSIRKTLSEELYSSQYNLWQDEAAEQYGRYYELYNSVLGEGIKLHSELKENIMKTTFENGVSVIINFGNSDFAFGGQIIRARDFMICKEEVK